MTFLEEGGGIFLIDAEESVLKLYDGNKEIPDRVSNPGQPDRKARALPLRHRGVLIP